MKPNQTRLAFIRSRYLARFAALSVISSSNAAPSAAPSPSAPSALSSLPSLPLRPAHVWRKTTQDADTGEALPLGFTPREIEPFSPLVSRAMLAEVEPIAYAESLPEIGAHNLQHSVNCMLIALPWRA